MPACSGCWYYITCSMQFSEVQKFKQWLWVILPSTLAGTLTGIIVTFTVSDSRDKIFIILLSVIVPLSVLLLFVNLKLKTEVDDTRILLSFKPFLLKGLTIPWADVAEAGIRKYNPLLEYGGWGYRISRKRGKAYNVSGDKGLQLVMQNGKRILIGTQRTEALQILLNELYQQGIVKPLADEANVKSW